MAPGDTWRKLPLYYVIIEALERRGGRAVDEELYKDIVDQRYDITFSEFLHELMKLEMQGLVRVNVLKEDKRNVELVRSP